MQNEIDAALSIEDRDRVLELLTQIRALLPFLVDLSPDDRRTLFKMGESGRPFVEATLTLVENDDSFMPRSFDKTVMRKDSDLYETLLPVYMSMATLFDGVDDTMMLTGSDLMIAGTDIWRNARNNGRGENIDPLVPLLARRFARNRKPKTETEPEKPSGGENQNG